MTTNTNTGRRVQITQPGNRHLGSRGTVVNENKFSYKVKVDGARGQGIWVRKPETSNSGCNYVRGRRPKVA